MLKNTIHVFSKKNWGILMNMIKTITTFAAVVCFLLSSNTVVAMNYDEENPTAKEVVVSPSAVPSKTKASVSSLEEKEEEDYSFIDDLNEDSFLDRFLDLFPKEDQNKLLKLYLSVLPDKKTIDTLKRILEGVSGKRKTCITEAFFGMNSAKRKHMTPKELQNMAIKLDDNVLDALEQVSAEHKKYFIEWVLDMSPEKLACMTPEKLLKRFQLIERNLLPLFSGAPNYLSSLVKEVFIRFLNEEPNPDKPDQINPRILAVKEVLLPSLSKLSTNGQYKIALDALMFHMSPSEIETMVEIYKDIFGIILGKGENTLSEEEEEEIIVCLLVNIHFKHIFWEVAKENIHAIYENASVLFPEDMSSADKAMIIDKALDLDPSELEARIQFFEKNKAGKESLLEVLSLEPIPFKALQEAAQRESSHQLSSPAATLSGRQSLDSFTAWNKRPSSSSVPSAPPASKQPAPAGGSTGAPHRSPTNDPFPGWDKRLS